MHLGSFLVGPMALLGLVVACSEREPSVGRAPETLAPAAELPPGSGAAGDLPSTRPSAASLLFDPERFDRACSESAECMLVLPTYGDCYSCCSRLEAITDTEDARRAYASVRASCRGALVCAVACLGTPEAVCRDRRCEVSVRLDGVDGADGGDAGDGG